ncbi:hypothetical protein E2C01_027258 [Portunus trituberculatus]|uniref:Uncharacterized protein n=1 Tax=Portunus trituberculatus TaxID=210409 RepID=A0A5B7EHF4_PORTR|nr:hypothetical protein [Portunus trituberculatus]
MAGQMRIPQDETGKAEAPRCNTLQVVEDPIGEEPPSVAQRRGEDGRTGGRAGGRTGGREGGAEAGGGGARRVLQPLQVLSRPHCLQTGTRLFCRGSSFTGLLANGCSALDQYFRPVLIGGGRRANGRVCWPPRSAHNNGQACWVADGQGTSVCDY